MTNYVEILYEDYSGNLAFSAFEPRPNDLRLMGRITRENVTEWLENMGSYPMIIDFRVTLNGEFFPFKLKTSEDNIRKMKED